MAEISLKEEQKQDYKDIRKLIEAVQHRFNGKPWTYLDMPVTPLTMSLLVEAADEALARLEADE